MLRNPPCHLFEPITTAASERRWPRNGKSECARTSTQGICRYRTRLKRQESLCLRTEHSDKRSVIGGIKLGERIRLPSGGSGPAKPNEVSLPVSLLTNRARMNRERPTVARGP